MSTSQTSSISRFRGTWNPVWMDDNQWLKQFKVEHFFDMYHQTVDEDGMACDDDAEDAFCEPHQGTSPTGSGASSSSWSEGLLQASDDDVDAEGVERLLDLFAFTARAILQPAPWADPPLSRKQRRGLLGVLLHRFLDRCANPILLGKRIKDALRSLQHEDVATDLFCHYVSYMSGAPWDQKTFLKQQQEQSNGAAIQRKSMLRKSCAPMLQYFDHYRSPFNFYGNQETYRAFREECDASVEQRLHIIQQDVSRSEAKATRAIAHWNSIRAHDGDRGCFGNTLTVELRDIALDLTATTLREEKFAVRSVDPNDDDADDAPVEVLVVDSSRKLVRRTRTLTKDVDVTIALVFDGSVDVVLPLRGAHHRPLALDDGKRLSWPRTQPMSFFLGHGGRSVENASLNVQVRRRGLLCGLREGGLLAEFSIPLKAPLYTDIAGFDAVVREALGTHAGVHAQRVQSSDVLRGVCATVDVYLHCLEPAHNERPPPMDVAMEEERRRRVIQNVRDDVWRVDHHAQFKELADTIGELDSDVYMVLELYADRYLIHDELRQTVLLVHAAVQSDFTKEDDRTLIEEALRNMMSLRGSITTRVCAKLMDSAMRVLRVQGVERLVTLESIVPSAADAGGALDKIRTILNLTGLSAADFPRMIASKSKEAMEPFVRKLHKLNRLLASGVPNGFGAVMGRMSVLPELDACPDKRELIAKARVLVDVVEECFRPLVEALRFAVDSGHVGVQALMASRVDAALMDMHEPLESCVHCVVTGILHSATEPNPLSDACGMLMAFYERVMNLVTAVGALGDLGATLDDHCHRLVKLLDPFFPLWFHLCKGKQPSWVAMLVEHEPLDPVAPNKVFHNQTPADAQNIMDALLMVFLKALRWSDPSLAAVNIICFAKLLASFVEDLCASLVVKAAQCEHMSEHMVGLCTYCRLCEMLQDAWTDVVEGTLIATEFRPTDEVRSAVPVPGAPPGRNGVVTPPAVAAGPIKSSSEQRDMLFAQCAAIKASTLASLVEAMHANLLEGIVRRVRRNFRDALLLRMESTDDGPWGSNTFAEENMKELRKDLQFDLYDSIGVALPHPPLQDDADGGGGDAAALENTSTLDPDVEASRSSKRLLRPSIGNGRRSISSQRSQRRLSRRHHHHGDLTLVARELRDMCVRAVFHAFRDFAMTFGKQTLAPGRKTQLMRILEEVDTVIREIWPPSEDWIDEALLPTQTHAARAVVLWLCHSSSQLIHVLTAGGGDSTNPADEMMLATVRNSGESELLTSILAMRTDKEAQKYVKNSF